MPDDSTLFKSIIRATKVATMVVKYPSNMAAMAG
jgi:hypothetical protein